MTLDTWKMACVAMILAVTVGCSSGSGASSDDQIGAQDLIGQDTGQQPDGDGQDLVANDSTEPDDQIPADGLLSDQVPSDLVPDTMLDGQDGSVSDVPDGNGSDLPGDGAQADAADGNLADADVVDAAIEVPPLEQVANALLGTWEMVAFVDSGNPQVVPPGSQFNVFQANGTVLMQCGPGFPMPFDIIEKWGMPTIHVTIGEGSEVFWVITKLTASDLWYVEGGDEFRFVSRANCP